MKLLVTGGAGFIGSAFVRSAFDRWPEAEVVVLDLLTYAGNRTNLSLIQNTPGYSFVRGDIGDPKDVRAAISGCTHVVNFAAETHVDRSILDAAAFIRTNVEGTRVLLDAARDSGVERFLQVSTDEVYGDVSAPTRSTEEDALQPRSPYAASKAAAEMLVFAYHSTFDVPVLVSRGSNTYGPYQYPEKLMPLFVTNAIDGLPLPVYGDGRQVRDWMHVDDHCAGIATVLERGEAGEVYNVASENELPNGAVIDRIIELTGCDRGLIRHVRDRLGHDRRYALGTTKVRTLGWTPRIPFDVGLEETVNWYMDHRSWWEPIKSGRFREYYQEQYEHRLTESNA